MMLYHGSKKDALNFHIGICFASDIDTAESYARGGNVFCVEIDLNDLVVIEVDSYDHDDDTAIGDNGEFPDADVIIYEDEDYSGYEHITYRIVSEKALASITIDENF